MRNVPFYNPKSTGISKVETFLFSPNTQLFVDTINFCNDAGGAAYQPVTQDTAIQMSQSLMLQVKLKQAIFVFNFFFLIFFLISFFLIFF